MKVRVINNKLDMELKSTLESLLLISGEPIAAAKLARITDVTQDAVVAALVELQKEYASRGFALLEKDGEYQLATHPDAARAVEALIKGEFSAELSRSALETIAIVAYKGPLTRAEIEFIRGVNSSFILRNLLMRGLAERIDNPGDARSYLYRISFEFLKHFGIERIENLPQFEAFKKEKIEIPTEENEK